MNEAHLKTVVEHQLEDSIREVQIDRARKAYAASIAKILSWTPGDSVECIRVYAEALGNAQHLIALLEGER